MPYHTIIFYILFYLSLLVLKLKLLPHEVMITIEGNGYYLILSLLLMLILILFFISDLILGIKLKNNKILLINIIGVLPVLMMTIS